MLKYIIVFAILFQTCISEVEKKTFMICEHAVVNYLHPDYVKNFTFTSRRYSREDPMYYISLAFTLLKPADNSFKADVYIYELLTNVYKPSFVEFHFKLCDYLRNDIVFGPSLRAKSKDILRCPLLPGVYETYNMSSPSGSFLKGFPFQSGRVYANITSGDNVLVCSVQIDTEIRNIRLRRKKKN